MNIPHQQPCVVCGRLIVHYTLRMDPKAPTLPVYCAEHDPKNRPYAGPETK